MLANYCGNTAELVVGGVFGRAIVEQDRRAGQHGPLLVWEGQVVTSRFELVPGTDTLGRRDQGTTASRVVNNQPKPA